MDIILPVYNGLKDLKKCIDSLLNATNTLDWRAFIINDASTEPGMLAYLESLHADERLIVLHNETNLGFVKTVNKGLSQSQKDVVLVNSDTIVFHGWLDRLVAHASRNARVATITPFSNNATIASFPEFCSENNSYLGLSAEQIDAFCYQTNRGSAIEIPTGVGFCMFIAREALEVVGPLNEKDFGRGYGEENDFCLRATAKGFVHLLACDVYVSHTGAVSFGAEKQERVRNAVKKLNELYPGYDKTIHKFIALDSVRQYRLKTLLKLSHEDTRPAILHMCHHHGGGTLQHVRELATHFEDQALSWILRSLSGDKVRLEWATAPSSYIDIDTEKDKVFFWEILKYIGISRLHIHHIAGLPKEVFTFIREAGLDYDITLHDYYFIGAHPTLRDSKGRFKLSSLPDKALQLWQAEKHALLKHAKRVLCPSEASKTLYQNYYSDIDYQVVPHLDSLSLVPYPGVTRLSATKAAKVLVLGALNAEKGADILEAAAKALHKTGRFQFTLLGYAYRRLHEAVRVLGAYELKDVDKLIADENPDFIWFPAVWAETYSYTLSVALRSGKPILAPDLGAFPERLAHRPLTKLYGSPADIVKVIASLKDFSAFIASAETYYPWPHQAKAKAFYPEAYVQTQDKKLQAVLTEAELFEGLSYRFEIRLNQKEKLLSILLGLKRYAFFRFLLRLLPSRQKLRVVRFFTEKNLLDVERQTTS